MTVSVTCSPAGPSPIDASSAALTRKRRRRAPASGASDDCFACSKRNVKCDRRRPYCSQCLELGSECSGYKTQLTWGVGVASRGKLRGLSLPVAKSAPAPKSPVKTRPRTSSTISRHAARHVGLGDRGDNDEVKIKLEGQGSMLGTPYTTYDFINMVPNSPTAAMHAPSSSAGSDWNLSMSQEYLRPSHGGSAGDQASHGQLLRQSLQRLNTPTNVRSDGMHTPSSAGAMSVYSDRDYGSPLEQTFQVDDVPFLPSPNPGYNHYPQNSPVDNGPFGMMGDPRGPTSCPDPFYAQSEISSSMGSHRQTIYEVDEARHLAGSPADNYSHSDIFFDDETSAVSAHESEQYLSNSHRSVNSWSSVPESEYGSSAVDIRYGPLDALSLHVTQDISPRVHFFLNYYENIVCPVTVAIDSPSNPYRHRILKLAGESRSVQHAVCALASCNIRMKRKHSIELAHWRRGSGHGVEARMRRASNPEDAEEEAAIAEEYRHRTQAVQLLNQHLSDPTYARHDSVLATLLILCHYRMAETGIAHFRTQFAGAKKLMGMRSCGNQIGNWGWMDSAFTFFDAITATVNDREAQLCGSYLDMVVSSSSPESGLENMAGCDARLFKIIATLGRLNLLSQNRAVLTSSSTNEPPHANPGPIALPRPRLTGQALADYYRVNSQRFDGNGFTNTLSDEDILPSFAAPMAAPNPSPYPDDDLRAQFWNEWQATRTALESWTFDPHRLSPRLPTPPSGTQMRDFNFVSEAFRHAALIYTERLASPSMPRAATNFRNLVSQTLYHISSLSEGSTAEKFLLWPLFVAGSEAVSEEDRDAVRAHCRRIVARGGYSNNLAALDVLEKVWAESEDEGRGFGGSPFRWTKFMESVEGEFIMV
ncbi:MAG: hypothetical protein M1818_007249 [Claussenomyces sp. TS43310]|nr:MAG: hypothetical protein M1818_007249 [Claussenomyces sp. TS43310]